MILRSLMIALLATTLAACGRGTERETGHVDEPGHGEHGHDDEAESFERGPKGGRLLRDGAFAIEVTIFEQGVPPEFRLYAYENDAPLAPSEVQARLETTRLDGDRTVFEFSPEADFLRGNAAVSEPHSFDVLVLASHQGKSHQWPYESYEGRVTIAPATAAEAGVKTEAAGPAVIGDKVNLVGTIILNPNLLTVEANESMREYAVTAPFDGVVLSRETNVGDVTGEQVLIEIADLSEVIVELHALGEQSTQIAVGQPVRVKSATTSKQAESKVSAVLPLATRGQSVVIRARLDNDDGQWRPGMTVAAEVVVAQKSVPLAVRETALQRFRNFTVVFAQVGDQYEVRMLELGARDGTFAEVLSGLEPGTTYVTEQSFLIKADIEKSGAGHDH
jgi:cobalt-zinc-cadmium efflux system membrane fusion protein